METTDSALETSGTLAQLSRGLGRQRTWSSKGNATWVDTFEITLCVRTVCACQTFRAARQTLQVRSRCTTWFMPSPRKFARTPSGLLAFTIPLANEQRTPGLCPPNHALSAQDGPGHCRRAQELLPLQERKETPGHSSSPTTVAGEDTNIPIEAP